MGDFLKSSFGKMFMELLARHREKTSEQSSKLSGKSARETIAFLDMRKTSKDGKFTLQGTRCLGCCGLAPVMVVNEDVYGKVTPEMVKDILAKY